ncbi:MAG: hypothetical protein AAGK32_20990 [Actinomycetota bacterium]
MMLAAVGDTPYNIVLLVHILTAMAAFAPAFAHPFLTNQSKAMGADGHGTVMGYLVANGRRIYAPALIVTGLAGFALQGMSDGLYEFGQAWIIIAIVVWIAMNGVLHALVIPNERKMAGGDASGEQLVTIGGVVITVLLVVMLYLMIFKPGV